MDSEASNALVTPWNTKEFALGWPMQMASRPLLNGSLTVSEIAWLNGLTDEAYFCRRLKPVRGQPPRQLRRDPQNARK